MNLPSSLALPRLFLTTTLGNRIRGGTLSMDEGQEIGGGFVVAVFGAGEVVSRLELGDV